MSVCKNTQKMALWYLHWAWVYETTLLANMIVGSWNGVLWNQLSLILNWPVSMCTAHMLWFVIWLINKLHPTEAIWWLLNVIWCSPWPYPRLPPTICPHQLFQPALLAFSQLEKAVSLFFFIQQTACAPVHMDHVNNTELSNRCRFRAASVTEPEEIH